ncbi:MAG TPA: SpoIID/LytB domain-containing protein [Candidatus Aquicultor sp.]|jgi:SpoIID/LytB domain protein
MRKNLLIISLLALCAILLIGSPAFAECQYTLKGFGYGHGIGLCQWGAKGRADAGQTYSEILTHYFQGAQLSGNYAGPASVRVRLFGASNLAKATVEGVNGSALDFVKTDGTYAYQGAKGQWSVAANPDSTLRIISPEGSTTVDRLVAPLVITSNSDTNMTVYNTNGKRFHVYSGAMYIYPAAKSTVYLVNNVGFEPYYLNGLGEVPSSWPYDALYSQAVAARSYAIANMHPQSTFDLYDDTRSQVYVGVDKINETSGSTNWGARWAKAVADTNGQVMVYDGKVISCYYYSSCGGHTENIELAWSGSTAKPYLKGVSDLDSSGKAYCQQSGNSSFSWQQAIAKSTFESKLGITGITGVAITKTGASPRIVELKITKTDGSCTAMSGATLRTKLGLKSTWVAQITGTFPDVSLGYWAFPQIEDLAAKNVIGGYSDGRFKPTATVTRAEFAKMLCLALNIPTGGTSTFVDVNGNWAESYISALVAKGITNGYSDGTFRPSALITRAEICTIIARAKTLTTGSKPASFPDISSHWAETSIELVASNGIVTGYPEGAFKPGANATRAEIAVIISRMLAVK